MLTKSYLFYQKVKTMLGRGHDGHPNIQIQVLEHHYRWYLGVSYVNNALKLNQKY